MSSSLSTITAGNYGGISGITADTLVNINNYSGINLSLVSENVSSDDGRAKAKPKIYIVDTERIVNQDLFSEELKCRICHGVLMNPLECNFCENCFCMNCLQKWLQESGKCPFKCDGEPDFKMKPHKIIRNMLSKLKLKCRNQESGCNLTVDYDKLEVHEEVECQFEMYECP